MPTAYEWNSKECWLIFNDMVYTPVEQLSPNPAERHKIFVNDEYLKCSKNQTEQIQASSKNVSKTYEAELYPDKSITKPKFFLQISDHQRSVVPFRGPFYTTKSCCWSLI
jgi:hypothetical protein